MRRWVQPPAPGWRKRENASKPKNKLKLLVITMLGIVFSAVAEMGALYLGVHLYLRFPGTILVTFLCGAFPGILAEAGCMLLQYAFEASRSGFDYLIFTIPIYNLLNAAAVALIIDAFLRRGAYRNKWNLLLREASE